MIAYILKSSLSLIVLFGLYWFLLRKEKLFVFNRFFLIASLIFSLVLPFITVPVNLQAAPRLENFIPVYDNVVRNVDTRDNVTPVEENISQTYTEKHSPAINILTILLILYVSGVLVFLVRFLRNIFIIVRTTKSAEKISYKGYRLVLTDDKTGSCCFFHTIFVNRDDYLNGRIENELLDHELEHAKQSHTIDIILIEVMKIFYWFNPVHILYDRAIRINHEYLADNRVIGERSDINNYAEKLLKFIASRSNMPLTSGSNHSFTKKRLLMMSRTKSRSYAYSLRITITLSLILVFSLFLSFKPTETIKFNSDILQLNKTAGQAVPGKEENIPFLVTFGKDAQTAVGDDDFHQVWFFCISSEFNKQFYIRVFDPDCGDKNDEIQGDYNTKTMFSVYGGKGVDPDQNEGSKGSENGMNYKGGTMLVSKIFGSETRYDDKYFTFGPFNPAQGDFNKNLNAYLFKVVVEGISGDDGNLYRFFMSRDPQIDVPVQGGNAFTYEYTFRMWNDLKSVSHLYPYINKDVVWVKQKNFDWDGDGNILIVSRDKQGIAAVSGEDSWAESRVAIDPAEKGSSLDIQLIKNQNMLIKNNNVSISFENQYGEALPIFSSPIGGSSVSVYPKESSDK